MTLQPGTLPKDCMNENVGPFALAGRVRPAVRCLPCFQLHLRVNNRLGDPSLGLAAGAARHWLY
eukprot:6714887-Lingulodinium_polyedra.AAC.1